MIRYELEISHPHRHFIKLKCSIPVNAAEMIVQLPVWRPGRYERGDFAKNIRSWQVISDEGNPLKYEKISSHTWKIFCENSKTIHISYEYYAAVLNAGSTWLDETQLYVNPVNCFLYLPSSQDSGYEVKLKVPSDWQIASGLKQTSGHTLVARDVQEMMDSPFICSANIEHLHYECNGILFHIWIKGELPIVRNKLISDFKAFTQAQLAAFGSFPVDEYHFLFQFTPYKSYHGVEHENSTVIALGPSQDIVPGKLYEELLGVSCHELYHTWNIKNIRPKEMFPYDFSKENYSRLGYVAEGVTTYFGDQFLHRCGVFSDEQYFKELSTLIDKHLENPGRFNLSVAESSFDTWLDGYNPGIPWRKVSIYNEGALCAFLTDIRILASSENSLDTVMKELYVRFGKKSVGYTEEDYRSICESNCNTSLDDIFEQLIYGTEDYIPFLTEAFNLLGFELGIEPSGLIWEAEYGIRLDENLNVTSILPGSSADVAGIWFNDRIISLNGVPVKTITDLFELEFHDLQNSIGFVSAGIAKSQMLKPLKSKGFLKSSLQLKSENELYTRWKNR